MPSCSRRRQATLNEFMSLGKPAWQEARATLTRLLSSSEGVLRDNEALRREAIMPQVHARRCWRQRRRRSRCLAAAQHAAAASQLVST